MLIVGDAVCQWVGAQLGFPVHYPLSQGVGWLQDNTIKAGLLFYDYTRQNMNVHVAFTPGFRWNPTLLAAMMDYPFNQAQVQRLTGVIPKRNIPARELADHLGAELEGEMKNATSEGDSLMIYGLQREGASKWLTPAYQRRLESTYGKVCS